MKENIFSATPIIYTWVLFVFLFLIGLMCGKQWNFEQNYIFGIQSETAKLNQSKCFSKSIRISAVHEVMWLLNRYDKNDLSLLFMLLFNNRKLLKSIL